MAKVKAALKATKRIAQTPFGKGIGIATAAKVVEEATDNPYAQAALGAAEGAALGAALGPWGMAGGAVAGGLLGFVLADGERIMPCDMVAIPAYQYASVLQGREPTFQLFIKEGEVVKPILPTDAQQTAAVLQTEAVASMPRKLSKWQRYIKVKRNQITFKSGTNKGRLNLKAMSKAGGFGKNNKGGKK